MRKTTVLIDEELLRQAMAAMVAQSKKEAIEAGIVFSNHVHEPRTRIMHTPLPITTSTLHGYGHVSIPLTDTFLSLPLRSIDTSKVS